jgi:hypothetical protein
MTVPALIRKLLLPAMVLSLNRLTILPVFTPKHPSQNSDVFHIFSAVGLSVLRRLKTLPGEHNTNLIVDSRNVLLNGFNVIDVADWFVPVDLNTNDFRSAVL